jgi:hypothetical protein
LFFFFTSMSAATTASAPTAPFASLAGAAPGAAALGGGAPDLVAAAVASDAKKAAAAYQYIRWDGESFSVEQGERAVPCDGPGLAVCQAPTPAGAPCQAVFSVVRYYLCARCATMDQWMRVALRIVTPQQQIVGGRVATAINRRMLACQEASDWARPGRELEFVMTWAELGVADEAEYDSLREEVARSLPRATQCVKYRSDAAKPFDSLSIRFACALVA